MIDAIRMLEWLREQPRDQFVGYRGSPCDCPVATYARALGAMGDVGVGLNSLRVGSAVYALDHHVEDFVRHVDTHGDPGSTVTAGEAADLMEVILR